MSDRLLRLINYPHPDKPSIHLFTDDLSGFAWVLVWAAIVVGLKEQDLTANNWLKMWNVDSYCQVMAAKDHIHQQLRWYPNYLPYSVRPIADLLISIFDTLAAYGEHVNTLFIELSNTVAEDNTRTSMLQEFLALRDKVYCDVTGQLRLEIDKGTLPTSWKQIPKG